MAADLDASIAGVYPLAGFDKLLHYRVPESLRSVLAPGFLVRVPILNRQKLALVAEFPALPELPPERLKLLSQAVYPFAALTTDLLALARWMSSYYAAGMESVLEAMIPAAVRGGVGWKQEKYLSLAAPLAPELADELGRRAPRQAELCAFLAQQFKPLKKALVLRRLGLSAATCSALVERGLVREESRRVERVAYDDPLGEAEWVKPGIPSLNPEQEKAVASVGATLREGRFSVHLLHGVTGSGKTEVYLRLMQEVLAQGGGVIYLVPEVALTPQTVGRLRSRLEAAGAGRPIVWHSHLSEGERLDGWFALATGEARVVVGARSAVFAPVRNLRLIIVDEEHEPAYKQDETPRYHGRDVAVYRAMLNDCVCLLGSATPSLESAANVRAGKYRLDQLTRRVDDRKLPIIHVVDMRKEILRQRGPLTLSQPLVDRMLARFHAREQTLLFINRRGYSSSLLCRECGYVAQCEHCSVALTYHRSDETLKCHLCADEKPVPLTCPSCRSPSVRWRGTGTQRVEEAVRRILPQARLERIDADTMARKNRFREILSDFRLGRIDILVGTQMIGKGLDFPNVTLVGLVDADLSMHLPDFRANERTFQLLVQVAGRAGRGDRAGEVIVQTFTPHAEAIQFSRHADYDGFVEAELRIRETFGYPPFRHLIQHLFRGPNADKVRFVAEHWVRQAKERLGDAAEIRGPAAAPIERVKDLYRMQVWYFVRRVGKVVPELIALRKEFVFPDDVTHVIDVDACNLA